MNFREKYTFISLINSTLDYFHEESQSLHFLLLTFRRAACSQIKLGEYRAGKNYTLFNIHSVEMKNEKGQLGHVSISIK